MEKKTKQTLFGRYVDNLEDISEVAQQFQRAKERHDAMRDHPDPAMRARWETIERNGRLILHKNRNDFIEFIRNLFGLEQKYVSASPEFLEFQQRLEELAKNLVYTFLPCPWDYCGRPYRHDIRDLLRCMQTPKSCDPIPLLNALQREILINEYSFVGAHEDRQQLAFEPLIERFAKQFNVTYEIAHKALGSKFLEPQQSSSTIFDFDPLFHFRFNEYVNRQTTWGLRQAFDRERGFVAKQLQEVDLEAFEINLKKQLEQINRMTLYSQEAKALAPLPLPSVENLSKKEAEEVLESWHVENLNRQRRLAQLLEIPLEPEYTCSLFPPQPHICWWKQFFSGGGQPEFPPLNSTFWFVYNFLTQNSIPPDELEENQSLYNLLVCRPNKTLVQKQLEDRRDKLPKHKITPQLQQQYDQELEEAMASFAEVERVSQQQMRFWEDFDNRLNIAIEKLQGRFPNIYKNSPDFFDEDEDEEEQYVLKITKPRDSSTPIQKTDLEPAFVSPSKHWGKFQKNIFAKHIRKIDAKNKEVGQEVIKYLWEEYQLAKVRGDKFFYGRPLKEWIFLNFEEPGHSEEDIQDFYKRYEKVKKIRKQAKKHRKELLLKISKKREE